jgi:hypothetical protein
MKHSMFVYLMIVFAAGMNVQGFAQEDQEGGAGMGLRGLRGDAMYPYPTNSATIKKNRRILSARILSGVRRLVPQEYSTIQVAIDSSTHGDTVLVSDGIYVENIRFRGKAIIVASLYLVDGDTSHIEQTIIDGSNPSHPDSASVVYFIDGEDTTSVLCGFTIRGGAGTLWTNQVLWRAGGGVFCVGAFGATIKNNRITENRISGENVSGGAIEFFADQGVLILERNRIFGNRVSANPNSGYGGAADIWGDGVYARIVDNIFERDTIVAQDYAVGGAVYLGGNGPLLAGGVVRGNLFRENISDAGNENGVAGGIYFYATAAIEVSKNIFEGNIAKSNSAFAEGGGLAFEDRNVPGYGRKMVKGNTFVNNMAITQSGIYGSGGAIELFYTLATISGNYIAYNNAQGGTARGGAIQINKSAFRLENNIYADNTSKYGGAVYVEGTPQSGTGMDIINNTIVNNTASITGGGIRVDGVQVKVNVINSILWGNSPNQIATTGGGSIEVRYSNIQGSWSGEGNMDVNPFFANTIDYQLSDSSLCIGAGIDSINIGGSWYYAPPFDSDGDPRPNPVDMYVDIGAQESPYERPPTGIAADELSNPMNFALHQNYPNPFNPTTNIEFLLPHTEFVTLKIYTILGEEVATLLSERLNAGGYQYEWDAGDHASGVYYYRLESGNFIATRKMILLK